jgi:hypothetical protein
MADPAVAGVEARGVQAVQALHPLRERRLPALDDQVEVVAHQAVRVKLPREPVGHAQQQVDEEAPVIVVHEDRTPIDTARRQVVDAVRERRAQRSGHEANLRRLDPQTSLCGQIVTLLFHWTRPFRPRPGPAPGHARKGRGVGRSGHVQGLALEMSAAATAVEEVSDQERR